MQRDTRIIFHVGMGKTGTTALQSALRKSGPALRQQKAAYLGMWFERLGPDFAGYPGLIALSRRPADEQRRLAGLYVSSLLAHARQHGIDTFVHSNESIFERPAELAPFFEALTPHLGVSFLVYLRPPREWLPSAFTQWGVRHKTQEGPIPPFRPMAERLVRTYDAIRAWTEAFEPNLLVRRFDGRDVVEDFEAATGLRLEGRGERHLERAEPAETVLRALFNNRFKAPLLPAAFDRSALKGMQLPAPSIAEMALRSLAHEGIEAVIEGRRETFAFIEERFGIDLLASGAAPEAAVDVARVKDRVVDLLAEMVLSQSLRIADLEAKLEALSARVDPSGKP